MKVYKCDFCNKIKTCKHKDIEGKEYDVCAACWSGIANKLKGKGREKPVEIAPWVPSVPWYPFYPVYPQPYWYSDGNTYQPYRFKDGTITCGDTTAGTGTLLLDCTTNALDITPS